MFKHIKKIDKTVIRHITKIQNPMFSKLLIPLTKVGSLGVIWLLIALPMLFFKEFRHVGVRIFIVVFLTGFVGEGIIKHLARRKRPSKYIEEKDMLIRKPSTYSFPSGHTSASVSSAMIISRSYPQLTIPVFLLAFLVSFSRLYFKVHYPSDILAGAALGVLLALIVNIF